MKLFEKLAKIEIIQPKCGKGEARKLFARAVKEHVGFNNRMKSAREHAINAGFDFLLARPAFEHGDWIMECQIYEQEISQRSIQRYMQLADLSWRYAIYKNPNVKDADAIRKLAIEMVLVSPKPMVELCRELGHMLKFGEYYPEDYQQKVKDKLLGDQLDFDFDTLAEPLQRLCHPKTVLPDDMEKLEELHGTLKSASLLVHRKIAELKLKAGAPAEEVNAL